MARALALLRALALEARRTLPELKGVGAHNFLLLTAFLSYERVWHGAFLIQLVAMVVAVPLSADPLGRLPPERSALLPFSPAKRLGLRLASLALNPVLWGVLLVMTLGGPRWRPVAVTVGGMVVVAQGLRALGGILGLERGDGGRFRALPPLPGILGSLMRKNLREQLQMLDTWLAVLLALVGVWLRLALPQEARNIQDLASFLVVWALSSQAQVLFGLDGLGTHSPYGRLPLPGWKILLAKDLAYLLILGTLTLPLAPLKALAAGLGVLTVGHHASVQNPRPQQRWRLVEGSNPSVGILQAFALVLALSALGAWGPLGLLPTCAAWALSLGIYGRRV